MEISAQTEKVALAWPWPFYARPHLISVTATPYERSVQDYCIRA
jgi:hypothetical protein